MLPNGNYNTYQRPGDPTNLFNNIKADEEDEHCFRENENVISNTRVPRGEFEMKEDLSDTTCIPTE